MECLPPPVPAEATLLIPPDMWPAYWRACPEGDRLPDTVPKHIWDAHCERTGRGGRPPSLVLNYWHHFPESSKALTQRVSAFPDEFWLELLQRHPRGLQRSSYYVKDSNDYKTGYYLHNGELVYKVYQNDQVIHMVRGVTGCDSI